MLQTNCISKIYTELFTQQKHTQISLAYVEHFSKTNFRPINNLQKF